MEIALLRELLAGTAVIHGPNDVSVGPRGMSPEALRLFGAPEESPRRPAGLTPASGVEICSRGRRAGQCHGQRGAGVSPAG